MHLADAQNPSPGTYLLYRVNYSVSHHLALLSRQPDVPVEYHPRIVEYCIAQAAELDDDPGTYQTKMSEFRGNLTKLQQNGEQPEGDGVYPSITYVSDWA